MGWWSFVVSLGTLAGLALGCAGSDPEATAAKGPTAALVVTEIDQAAVLNRPPRFLSLAPLEAQAGHPYTYEIDAWDPDGDEVEFSLVEAPPGASLEGHLLTWVPRAAQAGHLQGFTLRALDERGGSRLQTWQVVPHRAPSLPFGGVKRPFSGKPGQTGKPAT
jgi:hypothetical protein